MTNASVATRTVKPAKPLPVPNSDFYELYETLAPEELATVKRVRTFMETRVEPLVTKYWVDDAFPFELLPAVKELGVVVPLEGAGGKLTSTINSPIQLHGVTKVRAKRAPSLGEHNEEVLKQLGFNATRDRCVACKRRRPENTRTRGRGRRLKAAREMRIRKAPPMAWRRNLNI